MGFCNVAGPGGAGILLLSKKASAVSACVWISLLELRTRCPCSLQVQPACPASHVHRDGHWILRVLTGLSLHLSFQLMIIQVRESIGSTGGWRGVLFLRGYLSWQQGQGRPEHTWGLPLPSWALLSSLSRLFRSCDPDVHPPAPTAAPALLLH